MKEDKDLGEGIEQVQQLIFLVLTAFAAVGICVALLGCCFVCIKNRCCVCIYAILLIPTFLIYLGFGGAAVWASTNSDERVTEECKKVEEEINN